MNAGVEALVRSYRSRISDPDIFFAPSIPPRKLRNALKSYALGAQNEEVLALIDTSYFGGAKRGCLLTDKRIYARNLGQAPASSDLNEIDSVECEQEAHGLLFLRGKFLVVQASEIHINGKPFLWIRARKNPETLPTFAQMLKEIASLGRSSETGAGMDQLKELEIARTSCLWCGSQNVRPLILVSKVGIPPGRKGHNIVYRHALVIGCQECGQGYVENRDHDCFDFEEVWDQDDWFALTSSDISKIRSSLQACSHPFSSECPCPVHRSLRAGCSALPRLHSCYGLEDVPRISVELRSGVPELELRTGECTMCYPNGKKKAEGRLERGRLSGQWVLWHENGQKKAEGEFADDRRHGLWTEWNERGEKSGEATFRDGYTVALDTPETDSTTEP